LPEGEGGGRTGLRAGERIDCSDADATTVLELVAVMAERGVLCMEVPAGAGVESEELISKALERIVFFFAPDRRGACVSREVFAFGLAVVVFPTGNSSALVSASALSRNRSFSSCTSSCRL